MKADADVVDVAVEQVATDDGAGELDAVAVVVLEEDVAARPGVDVRAVEEPDAAGADVAGTDRVGAGGAVRVVESDHEHDDLLKTLAVVATSVCSLERGDLSFQLRHEGVPLAVGYAQRVQREFAVYFSGQSAPREWM